MVIPTLYCMLWSLIYVVSFLNEVKLLLYSSFSRFVDRKSAHVCVAEVYRGPLYGYTNGQWMPLQIPAQVRQISG